MTTKFTIKEKVQRGSSDSASLSEVKRNRVFNEYGQEIVLPDTPLNPHQRAMRHMEEQAAKRTAETVEPVEPKKRSIYEGMTAEQVEDLTTRLQSGDPDAEREAEELVTAKKNEESGKTKPVQAVEKTEPDQVSLRNAYQDELDFMSKHGSTPFLYKRLQEKYRGMGLKI